MAYAAPSFHSTKEKTNYSRLCRLLADFSTHVMRETFDKKRPAGNLDTAFANPAVYAVLQALRRKHVLNSSQFNKLYPPIKSSVSLKNFDFTLLVTLLRNICGLVPPATGWDTLPPAADTTLEADIVRIKFYRNRVYGHASEASVDDATFNKYWKDIQDALVRLGGACYQGAIDDLRSGSFVSVGKISFSLKDVLGKGADGTVVYKGKFESRDVAVKRILSDFVMIADKEVDILRQSDAHPNIIRYFCTEEDQEFRYIALELCEATLQEYVKDPKFERHGLAPETVLNQAMSGLSHLHSLNIVHRDIKPRNVLISKQAGLVKAMISDFGLCRKLPDGRSSVTCHSGAIGTGGWVAPELCKPGSKLKCSGDIFSSGCVFYFVLSGGDHPFGDRLVRQANIISGEFDVEKIVHSAELVTEAKDLIRMMLKPCPSDRPSAKEILKHPFFWEGEKQLAFFQDVSDRIDKESEESKLLKLLQKDSIPVVGEDWNVHLGREFQQELERRKFRTYNGSHVEDLLRAIRNKKHHYHELPDRVKKEVGSLPDGYMRYFSSRFPRLLMHTYNAMASCKSEPVFQKYYFQG